LFGYLLVLFEYAQLGSPGKGFLLDPTLFGDQFGHAGDWYDSLAWVAHANKSPQPWYPVKLGATNKKNDIGDRNKNPIPSAVLASFICYKMRLKMRNCLQRPRLD
jgi:hypothetical protein